METHAISILVALALVASHAAPALRVLAGPPDCGCSCPRTSAACCCRRAAARARQHPSWIRTDSCGDHCGCATMAAVPLATSLPAISTRHAAAPMPERPLPSLRTAPPARGSFVPNRYQRPPPA